MNSDDLRSSLEEVDSARADFQRSVGTLGIRAFAVASYLLSLPRQLFDRRQNADTDLQRPWLPVWPALTAKPVHSPTDFAWIKKLEAASQDILAELNHVRETFERARFDSDKNPSEWKTYYFYLQGKPVREHLDACPITRDLLAQIPHNGFHVCFSAIQPGGALLPHTGPTNTGLTAHLGLANCAGSRLWVADQWVDYIDNKVFVFDDSFVHCVENTSSNVRYTLMVTLWHPELSAIERGFMWSLVRWFPI